MKLENVCPHINTLLIDVYRIYTIRRPHTHEHKLPNPQQYTLGFTYTRAHAHTQDIETLSGMSAVFVPGVLDDGEVELWRTLLLSSYAACSGVLHTHTHTHMLTHTHTHTHTHIHTDNTQPLTHRKISTPLCHQHTRGNARPAALERDGWLVNTPPPVPCTDHLIKSCVLWGLPEKGLTATFKLSSSLLPSQVQSIRPTDRRVKVHMNDCAC